MSLLGIHHVRFAVGNPDKFARYLRKFGFQYYARGLGRLEGRTGLALRHQGVVFVIDERNGNNAVLNADGVAKDSFLSGNLNYPVDTVCDACFQCNNIEEISQRVKSTGIGSCLYRSKIIDQDGSVSYAVLQSPFSNLQHTLVDLRDYTGSFLPSFKIDDSYDGSKNSHVFCVDHLAYMVPAGCTDAAIEWYNYVFGFERLYINNDDLKEEGFKVEHGPMGMRLKAIHGIDLCATNCPDDHESGRYLAPVKFVFGEPLTSSTSDQISTFLDEHRGSGIQHIGLGTHNILEAVKQFKESGASFVTPPIEYYDDVTRREEIKELDISAEDLMKSGILVESSEEQSPTEVSLPLEKEPWYIMQVFTKNLFEEQTFFLELIQRHRTEGGFGAGNIKALWNGVQAHLAKLKQIENTA